MCKCICTPKQSGTNPKCDECHPGRLKPKGHDKVTHDEKKQRASKGRLGTVLEKFEPKPEDCAE